MKSEGNSFLDCDHTIPDQGAKHQWAMTSPCPSAQMLPDEALLSEEL